MVWQPNHETIEVTGAWGENAGCNSSAMEQNYDQIWGETRNSMMEHDLVHIPFPIM